MTASARIVCIPRRDRVFAADAEHVARRIPPGLTGLAALEWYQVELRRYYPTAEVREQDELARRDDADPVWYVTKREQHFRIDASVLVPLAPLAAYRVYVDRVVEWQTAVRLVPKHLTEDLVGSTWDACYVFLGRTYQGSFRVLAASPPVSVAFEATGSGITVWYETRFLPEGEGTRVAVKGDYELPTQLLTNVADRLGLERAIGRDIERANATYQALCEVEHRGRR